MYTSWNIKGLRISIAIVIALVSGWNSPASAGVAGDMNDDQLLNGQDIAPLLQSVLDPTAYKAEHPVGKYYDGDFNGDCLVDAEDVRIFSDRVMRSNGQPEATTGHFEFFTPTYDVLIPLAGIYPAHPDHQLKVTIMELPETGALIRTSPTVQTITTVPYELTSGEVTFNAYSSPSTGSPLVHFAYKVTSLQDGATSETRHVTISRFAGPQLNSIIPELFEDTPAIIQFDVANSSILPPGDSLEIVIQQPVSSLFGIFYQIEEDGVTFGQLIPWETVVTNSAHRIGFIPANNYCGNAPNFVCRAQDSMGLFVAEKFETLAIQGTNDPPFATSQFANASQLFTQFNLSIFMGYYDIDLNISNPACNIGNSLSLIFHDLPQNGELYVGSIAPENLISKPDTIVPDTTPYSNNLDIYYVKTAPGMGSPFDSFTWAAFDGVVESELATMTINYVTVNVPPVANPVLPVTVQEDSDWTYIPLTAFDPDEGPGSIRYFATSVPTQGMLQTMNIIGSGWVPVFSPNAQLFPDGPNHVVRYKPNPGENTYGQAPDTFSFRVMDDEDSSFISQPVSITITAVNDAPIISGPSSANAKILVPSTQHINAIINTLSVADDAGDQSLSVTINAINADHLFLNDEAGLSNFRQSSPTSMSFNGTITQINNALDAGLQFSPHTFGAGFINMSVEDWGNTGEEQPPQFLTVTHQIVVTITP
jgi:hypothetical protein